MNEREQDLIEGMDALHAGICGAQRDLFSLIVQADRLEIWREWGARDLAHFLSMRYGISWWKANRWIGAAHALQGLPQISEALATGELGIDKVVELTRFATPQTEGRLLRWATRVSGAAIRRRADLAARRSIEDAAEPDESRTLTWSYFDQGRRFGLSAELPAPQGAVVARALERLADSVPVMPGEEGPGYSPARRADALVGLCSARIAADPDPDRATVVIHAQAEGLLGGDFGCEIEGGPVIHPEVARRLGCTARLQAVVEDERGQALGMGRMSRDPSAAMIRQLRYRDHGCTFPGCGTRAFTQAHHVVWWDRGGRTDLDNLVLVCSFHHKLVHEYGWALRRDATGEVRWFRPGGVLYRAGPAPPSAQTSEEQPALSAAGF